MKMNSKLSAQITGNGIFGVLYNSRERMPSDLPQLAPSALVCLAPLPDLQFIPTPLSEELTSHCNSLFDTGVTQTI